MKNWPLHSITSSARTRMFCGTSMPSALAVFFTSPYQQGWDKKMAILSFCGIDVSKDPP